MRANWQTERMLAPARSGELADAAVGGRRVLYLLTGTTGHKIGVHVAAWHIRLFGRVPDTVRILVFDTDVREEVVFVNDPAGGGPRIPVRLQRDVEFIQLGRDLNIERLAVEVERNPALHPDTRSLLRLQPDGRRAGSLERGAEGEPLQGAIAGRWSAGRMGTAIRGNLAQLLHLELASDEAQGQGVTVFVGGSLAGGCGAPNLLVVAKELREAIDDMGVDPGRVLVLELAVLPEAFPDSELRMAVTWSTLTYHAAAFARGRLPFATAHTRPGPPFNMSFAVGPVTESGITLGGVDDVAGAVGLAAVVLGTYPLREAAAGLWANVVRRTESRLPTGEPMCLSSLGVFGFRFSRDEVKDYFANHIIDVQLGELLERKPSDPESHVRMTFAAHLADTDSLMKRLMHDDEGRSLLGTLARDSITALGRRSEKQVLESLQGLQDALNRRSVQALNTASSTMTTICETIDTSLARSSDTFIDTEGPQAGVLYMDHSVSYLDGLLSDVEAHRKSLGEALQKTLADREAVVARLRQPTRSLLSLRRSSRRPRPEALVRAEVAVALDGFAMDLAGLAIEALMGLRVTCLRRRDGVAGLVNTLLDIRQGARERQRSFEEAAATSMGVERTMHSVPELHTLFTETIDGVWDRLPEHLAAAITADAGAPSSWVGVDRGELETTLRKGASRQLAPVATMTADDYLAWKHDRFALNPEAFLRDALELASPLCRFERTRLPGEDDLAESSFHLVAVPDAGNSVFKGIPGVLLVSTSAPERLVFLTIRVGFPPSALWRAPRYRAAFEEVKQRKEIALDFYPGFPRALEAVPDKARKRRVRGKGNRNGK